MTLIFCISVLMFIDRVNISIAAKYIMPEYGLSDVQMGWIFSAFVLGYAILQVPGGRLGDRFGPRWVLAGAIFWWSAFTAVTALAGELFLTGIIGVVGSFIVVRILIGEATEETVAGFDEEIAVIEANLDDMNPQIYGYFLEKALAAGALDVYTTPVQMKKNRPGTLLTVLCKPQDTNTLMSLIFAETTTFGARTYRAQRRTLPREFLKVATAFGDVRIKISRANGRILHVAPEYDDCRKLAVEKSVPLQRVISEALRAYEAGGKTH